MLELSGVSAGYGPLRVLTDINLRVEEGEFVTVVGPNGAGKTTLMKTIYGLTTLHEGTVRFRGENLRALKPQQLAFRRLAYVPQDQNVFPSLSVLENLTLGIQDRAQQARNLEEVFTYFPRLKERQQQRAGTLSGGERQMLAIGCALMSDPTLLLLDEPSGGLAPLLVALLFEKITEIHRQGTSVLMVEQNARKALEAADRGYVLQGGRIYLEGTAEDLMHNEAVVNTYLGV